LLWGNLVSRSQGEVNPMPRLKHYDSLGTARFVTFCCHHFDPYLLDPLACQILAMQIDAARAKHQFRLIGYVIMPEHVHLLLWPPDDMKLGLVIGEIKSRMARDYFASIGNESPGRRVFWLKRCYDHNCRCTDVVVEKLNYCHNNPVTRGLVASPRDYTWSSFNWYEGRTDVPLQMDEVVLH
jgi:putative transposase